MRSRRTQADHPLSGQGEDFALAEADSDVDIFKDEETEAMQRQDFEERKKELGSEHPDTLASMYKLIGVLYSQGWNLSFEEERRYRSSEEAHEMEREMMVLHTLVDSKKELGPEHPSTLKCMSTLATILFSQGKYEEAEEVNRQTLVRQQKVLGPEHPDTLTTISNLTAVLDRQGKYEEAEAMNRQTLTQREKAIEPEHSNTSLDPAKPLPPCPRTTASGLYDDWYSLEGCRYFDVCPTCYEGVFANMPFDIHFKQTRLHEQPVERICDFGSPWVRLAWLLTIKQDLRACPGDRKLGTDRIN
jgi:tetratricopeptide (TPR) repeat protein